MRYPFSALVGQDQLQLALLLNAVDPEIGGVLVSGEKGTAKSTAARALGDLLPAIQVREGSVNSAPDDPVLDIDSGFIRLGRARELARALRSEYLPLEDLTADSLTLVIQERRRSAAPAFEIGMTDR